MTNLNALTDKSLDKRIDTLDSLMQEASRFQGPAGKPQGQAPEQFIARLKAASTQVEQQLAADRLTASATCKSGFLGLTQSCTVNGRTVPAADVASAKQLVPAAGLIQATLRGLIERYGDGGRWSGKRAEAFSSEIDAYAKQANEAYKALEGGDPAAAARLTAAVNAISDSMKRIEAEAAGEQEMIKGQKNYAQSFAPVANTSTGILGRTTSADTKRKDVYNRGLQVVDGMNHEVNAERQIAGGKENIVRPLVVGQLAHDPAFADRGYAAMKAKSEAWGGLIESASTASSKAQSFASTVRGYGEALSTVETAPGRIQELEASLVQARGALENAQRQRAEASATYSQEERKLSGQANSAAAELGDANRRYSAANANMQEWARAVDARQTEVNILVAEIAALDLRIALSQQSGVGGLGGGGQSGSGGLGGGGGQSGSGGLGGGGQSGGGGLGGGGQSGSGGLGGGSGLPQGPDPALVARRNQAVYQLGIAQGALAQAQHGYNQAAANNEAHAQNVAQRQATLDGIENQRRANRDWLGGYENAATQAENHQHSVASSLSNTKQSLVDAGETIRGANRSFAAAVDAYNSSRTALDRSVGSAAVGPEGQASIRGIAMPALDRQAVLAEVSKQQGGLENLGAMAGAVTDGSGKRAQTATAARDSLNQQMEQVVRAEIQRTLR